VSIQIHLTTETYSYAPEGFKIITNTHPKHGKTVERQADAEVIHYADVKVARVPAKVTFVIFATSFEDERNNRKYWL
jgi:hypothetical protein